MEEKKTDNLKKDEEKAEMPTCPVCKRKKKKGKVVRNGHTDDPARRQKYKCQTCGKSFVPTEAIPTEKLMARQILLLKLLGWTDGKIMKRLNVSRGKITETIDRYTHNPECFRSLMKTRDETLPRRDGAKAFRVSCEPLELKIFPIIRVKKKKQNT